MCTSTNLRLMKTEVVLKFLLKGKISFMKMGLMKTEVVLKCKNSTYHNQDNNV